MYKLISKSDFRDEFRKMGRGDNFSYDGLGALYDYLEEFDCSEEGIGQELDVIALCGDFTEYENIKEFAENYKTFIIGEVSIEDIEQETIVIPVSGERFIIQNF